MSDGAGDGGGDGAGNAAGDAAGVSRPLVPVAVGVLLRADGAVLLAQRPAGKPYAGYWEFPGGKVESGESIEQALARELAEELGVQVRASLPWAVIEYDYPHAHVRLHVRRVFDWSGTPQPLEGQRLWLLLPGAAPPQPLLPATLPILRWITLPTVTVVSPGCASDAYTALQWLDDLLLRGLRQVLWHEPQLGALPGRTALQAAVARAADFGACLLVDTRSAQAAGVASPDIFLDQLALRPNHTGSASGRVAAAVREPADLRRAAALGCDCAFAFPPSAPTVPLTAAWMGHNPLPVYAPGPLDLAALHAVQARGAHGLMVRAALLPQRTPRGAAGAAGAS